MDRSPADALDACPDCGGPSAVLTAVTVPALADAPRHVLVTRRCLAERCQLKFPVFRSEPDLSEEERRQWTRR